MSTAAVPVPGKALAALAAPGGRGRAACAQVMDYASELAAALRRALPFLARRRVAVNAAMPRCVPFAELALDATIVHASPFAIARAGGGGGGVTSQSPLRGLLLVDETALARILDGVFGGEGSSTTGTNALTSAQTALANRVSGAMLRAFGDVLSQKAGVAIEPVTSKEIGAGTAVVLALEIDGGGRIVIALPLAAVLADEPTRDEPVDSGIAAAMAGVELDVVAELGTVRLPLRAISNLQVGDVLRLTLPLDERARVCAGGAVLFHGRPTASGNVVGVALER